MSHVGYHHTVDDKENTDIVMSTEYKHQMKLQNSFRQY